MNLRRGELVRLAHLAKEKALGTAKDLEELSTEQFVDKLEGGDSGFLNQSKLEPGQKINYRELLKTPEGRSAIEGYKPIPVNEILKLPQTFTRKRLQAFPVMPGSKYYRALKRFLFFNRRFGLIFTV